MRAKRDQLPYFPFLIESLFFNFFIEQNFFLILSSINFLILAPVPFGPSKKKKKKFKLACNWFSNFKHLAIVSLQTWAKILLAAEIPAFTLDIQTRIS